MASVPSTDHLYCLECLGELKVDGEGIYDARPAVTLVPHLVPVPGGQAVVVAVPCCYEHLAVHRPSPLAVASPGWVPNAAA